jgi:hypothetical protein
MASQYLSDLARTIAGQVGLKDPAKFLAAKNRIGVELYNMYGKEIEEHIAKWSPETRGKIAAQGLGDKDETGRMRMSDVHMSSMWLSGSNPGNELVTKIASTVIVAAIADMIRNTHRQHAEQRPEEGASPGTPSCYIGYGGAPARTPTLDQQEGRRDQGGTYAGQFGIHE